jgi:hypothetical protein
VCSSRENLVVRKFISSFSGLTKTSILLSSFSEGLLSHHVNRTFSARCPSGNEMRKLLMLKYSTVQGHRSHQSF